MTESEIVKWVILAALGGFQWFIRNMITSTQTDIANLKKDLDAVKKEYLHKDDFKEFKTELRGMFEEIKQDIRDLKKNETH